MLETNIKAAVTAALDELLRRDAFLLEKDVNERSISHRFAVYLQSQFLDWDIDCEYNRNHDDVKRLELEGREASDTSLEAVTVFPDVIVHHRATDENLVVLEMKKSTSNVGSAYDIQKLRAFKKELGYKFAVFVLLETGTKNVGIKKLTFV